MTLVALQCLVASVGEHPEHERDKPIVTVKSVDNHRAGGNRGQLQRSHDSCPCVTQSEDLTRDVPAVEGINGQEIYHSPHNVHLEHVADHRVNYIGPHRLEISEKRPKRLAPCGFDAEGVEALASKRAYKTNVVA